MHFHMKKFLIKLLVITLSIAVIGGVVFTVFLPQYYLPILPFLLLFFFVVTLGVHAYQLQLAKKDMGKFTRSTMLVTFLKLVLYSILAVVYLTLNRENVLTFVICLMFLYIVFTYVEVSESLKQTKR